ncbi:MAG TPA: histidine phosphatase family protein [Rhodopila sp.]|nr:histidine phosphatase family protein [Rhodopila sp.]
MRIALIRHPTPAIGPGICYGRLDVGLDPSAQAWIDRLAADSPLPTARRIWTSPAIRCHGPANAIALALAAPLTVDPRLRELDFGHWEGQPWDVISRTELDRWAAAPSSFAAPGGESGADLIARVRAFHADLRRDGQDCMVVSHGGPLKILNALLRGKPVDLLAAAPPIGSVNLIDCHAASVG